MLSAEGSNVVTLCEAMTSNSRRPMSDQACTFKWLLHTTYSTGLSLTEHGYQNSERVFGTAGLRRKGFSNGRSNRIARYSTEVLALMVGGHNAYAELYAKDNV